MSRQENTFITTIILRFVSLAKGYAFVYNLAG